MWKFTKKHPYLVSGAVISGLLCGGSIVKRMINRIVPANTVLEIDFDNFHLVAEPLREFDNMFSSNSGMMYIGDLLKLLKYANNDDRVTGIIARVGVGGIRCSGLSVRNELRDAIAAFGKQKTIYITSQFQNSLFDYFVASSFDEIVLFPQGEMFIGGVVLTQIFVKNMLKNLEIECYVEAKKDYKTAGNLFSESEYTYTQREQDKRLVDKIIELSKKKLLESRDQISTVQLEQILNTGYLNTKKSLEFEIIDKVMYEDEFYKEYTTIKEGDDKKRNNLLYLSSYRNKVKSYLLEKKDRCAKKKVALLYLTGPILSGKRENVMGGNRSIYGEDVADAIDGISMMKDVDGLIIRVNSPGGSVIGSETIRRAIINFQHKSLDGNSEESEEKEEEDDEEEEEEEGESDDDEDEDLSDDDGEQKKKKEEEEEEEEEKQQQQERKKIRGKRPVVISMGPVAASGGYWISMSADRIIADEMTITGSIGIIGISFNFAGLLKKYGITLDGFQTGRYSHLSSPLHHLGEQDRKNISDSLEVMYEGFIKLVAEERGIPLERVRNEVARGKVYTGEEALDLGLIDRLGGLEDQAIPEMKRLLGMDDEEGLKIWHVKDDSLTRLLMNEFSPPKNSRQRKKRRVAQISDHGFFSKQSLFGVPGLLEKGGTFFLKNFLTQKKVNEVVENCVDFYIRETRSQTEAKGKAEYQGIQFK